MALIGTQEGGGEKVKIFSMGSSRVHEAGAIAEEEAAFVGSSFVSPTPLYESKREKAKGGEMQGQTQNTNRRTKSDKQQTTKEQTRKPLAPCFEEVCLMMKIHK